MPCPSTPIITACCSLSSLGATWHCPKPLPPITHYSVAAWYSQYIPHLPPAACCISYCWCPPNTLPGLWGITAVLPLTCQSIWPWPCQYCLMPFYLSLLTAYCLLLHSYTTCWYNLPFLTPSVSNIFSHIPHILHIPHIPTSDNTILDSWPSFLLLTLLNSHVWSIYSLHWHFSLTWILTPHEYNCFSQIPSLTIFLYWSNLFALVVLSWSSIPALHISYNILHLPCLLTFLPCLTLTHSYSLLLTLTHLANLNTSAIILTSSPDVSHHSSLSLQLIYPVPSAPAAYWILVTGPALFDLAACSSHIYLIIILPSDIWSISIFFHLTSNQYQSSAIWLPSLTPCMPPNHSTVPCTIICIFWSLILTTADYCLLTTAAWITTMPGTSTVLNIYISTTPIGGCSWHDTTNPHRLCFNPWIYIDATTGTCNNATSSVW